MSDGALPGGSELEQARHEITALKLEVEHLRVAQDELLHSISHDLRAPLRHVTSYVRIIREDLQAAGAPLDPQVDASLQRVAEAAQLQGRQIDGLMELSRLARSPVQCVSVALAAVVQEARDAVMQAYAGRSVQWTVAPDLPVVWADAALLRGVLERLLDNALKFSLGLAQASVSLRCQPLSDSHCTLQLSDNGAGFAGRQADKLFAPFQRLHSATEFEGLGMGLAWSRAALQRMDGAIAIASDARGCTVTLNLACPPAQSAAQTSPA